MYVKVTWLSDLARGSLELLQMVHRVQDEFETFHLQS